MPEVILLSGGIESTTLLHMLYAQCNLCPVFVDYGQRAAEQEYLAARTQCARLDLDLKKLDMSQVGNDFREGQTKKLHVPLPHRNLVALSLGLSYATQLGASRLYLALNQEDTLRYPSASLGFLTQFQALAGILGSVDILAPLVGLPKAQIIQHGLSLGVDYTLTYSCLLGYPVHCGHCPQCHNRQEAFREAGQKEPVSFYRK